MATRGSVGIRYKQTDKVGYNHFDSYPTGLGEQLLLYLKGNTQQNLLKTYNEIQTNGKQDVWDWEKHEINIRFQNYEKFLRNSLFCEFAYIINLDTEKLQFYVGFNKDKEGLGRYAKYTVDETKKYYGVVLKNEIPLKELFDGLYKSDDEFGFIKVD